jgi:hypothetical protein
MACVHVVRVHALSLGISVLCKHSLVISYGGSWRDRFYCGITFPIRLPHVYDLCLVRHVIWIRVKIHTSGVRNIFIKCVTSKSWITVDFISPLLFETWSSFRLLVSVNKLRRLDMYACTVVKQSKQCQTVVRRQPHITCLQCIKVEIVKKGHEIDSMANSSKVKVKWNRQCAIEWPFLQLSCPNMTSLFIVREPD